MTLRLTVIEFLTTVYTTEYSLVSTLTTVVSFESLNKIGTLSPASVICDPYPSVDCVIAETECALWVRVCGDATANREKAAGRDEGMTFYLQ